MNGLHTLYADRATFIVGGLRFYVLSRKVLAGTMVSLDKCIQIGIWFMLDGPDLYGGP